MDNNNRLANKFFPYNSSVITVGSLNFLLCVTLVLLIGLD